MLEIYAGRASGDESREKLQDPLVRTYRQVAYGPSPSGGARAEFNADRLGREGVAPATGSR